MSYPKVATNTWNKISITGIIKQTSELYLLMLAKNNQGRKDEPSCPFAKNNVVLASEALNGLVLTSEALKETEQANKHLPMQCVLIMY